MRRYLIRRLFLLIPVFIGVTFVNFVLIRIVPGDIVTNMMGVTAANNQEMRARVLHELGLDRSMLEQYFWWLGRIARGDFGYSFIHRGSVLAEITRCLPPTLEMCAMSMAMAILIGVPLGVFSAVRRGRAVDFLARVIALLGISAPNFFIGTLIVVFGAIYFPKIQTLGYVPFLQNPWENVTRMFWPSLTFAISIGAILLRYARSSVLEVLGEDYIRTAKAKGLSPFRIIFIHALKNALIPIITSIGIWTAFLIGGTVLIEDIFAIPGLGRLVLGAIQVRDYPVIQGTVLFISLAVAVTILVTDMLVMAVDPRAKLD
jgi:peptide/nickel transport system permease protein